MAPDESYVNLVYLENIFSQWLKRYIRRKIFSLSILLLLREVGIPFSPVYLLSTEWCFSFLTILKQKFSHGPQWWLPFVVIATMLDVCQRTRGICKLKVSNKCLIFHRIRGNKTRENITLSRSLANFNFSLIRSHYNLIYFNNSLIVTKWEPGTSWIKTGCCVITARSL